MTVLILYVWICLPRNPTRFFFKICIYALVPSNWEIVYLLHAKYYVQIFKNIKTSIAACSSENQKIGHAKSENAKSSS